MHEYIIPDLTKFNGIGFSRELTAIIGDLEPNSLIFREPRILLINHPFANAGEQPKPGIQNLLNAHEGATDKNMTVSELPFCGIECFDPLPDDKFTITK